MSDFFPTGAFPPSKKVLPEVNKLRQAISQGSLDYRQDLIEKLGEFALSLAVEARFDKVLEVMDEIIELTETLLQEGKIEITQTMLEAIFPISSVVKIGKMQRKDAPTLDEEAFFQRRKKCISMLPEKEFLRIKNEWALDIHERAEFLHGNGATIAAIALLDESLRMVEPLFDPKVRQFTERKPLLDIYRSRGIWKSEIGDQESGIADLLHFEQLSQQANDLLASNRVAFLQKNRGASHNKSDEKITIRISEDELLDHYASFSFQESRYEAILYLANVYHSRAEKEKALEYYDKALAIAEANKDVQERAGIQFFSAPMDIPHRKGALFTQYHQFEAALEQYDLAIKNAKGLLEIKPNNESEDDYRQKKISQLETHFAEIVRERAEILQNLGRFDEAKDATELTRQLFIQVLNPAVMGHDYPLSVKNILADASQRSGEPLKPLIAKGEKFDEQKIIQQFAVLHNEAMMDVQRAKIEMYENHWQKALRYLLKARFIVDSPVIISFPEAKKNVFSIYMGIAKAYAVLKEYDMSQRWYERTIKHALSLDDDGETLSLNFLCTALEGLADLYAKRQQYEKSLTEYELVFSHRTRLIEEQEAALEGLNREHLRIHDNQKLMPLAVLYRAQIETIRAIESQIFATNSSELAESWAKLEGETFENFRTLLLSPEQADGEHVLVTASRAAMLRWCGAEEKCQELLDRWIKEQNEQFETEAAARSYINSFMSIRLKELYALTDFQEGAELFNRLALQTRRMQFQAAYETARVLRSLLIYEQQQLQAPPLIKREFYANLIETVDHEVTEIRKLHAIDETESVFRNHPYDPDEVRAILGQFNEEEEEVLQADEPDDDENASLYERDFETAMDNYGMLFKMLDVFSGNNMTDKLLKGYDLDQRKGMIASEDTPVGRNDPCPCGSGKKYKVCCFKRQNR